MHATISCIHRHSYVATYLLFHLHALINWSLRPREAPSLSRFYPKNSAWSPSPSPSRLYPVPIRRKFYKNINESHVQIPDSRILPAFDVIRNQCRTPTAAG